MPLALIVLKTEKGCCRPTAKACELRKSHSGPPHGAVGTLPPKAASRCNSMQGRMGCYSKTKPNLTLTMPKLTTGLQPPLSASP